jgi:uncharacterized membrane protein
MNRLRRHPVPAALAALAALGVGISGYLTYTHWADTPVICGGRASCATVQSSEYASIAGVPLALFGVGFFAAVVVLAVLAALHPAALLAVFALSLGGLVYSAYLTWVEVAVLHAVCYWCVASALVIVALTALSGAALLRPAEPAPHVAPVRRMA